MHLPFLVAPMVGWWQDCVIKCHLSISNTNCTGVNLTWAQLLRKTIWSTPVVTPYLVMQYEDRCGRDMQGRQIPPGYSCWLCNTSTISCSRHGGLWKGLHDWLGQAFHPISAWYWLCGTPILQTSDRCITTPHESYQTKIKLHIEFFCECDGGDGWW